LKAHDTKAYERTIINFYLPSMNLGDGSWATISYTPDRHMTINGLTREEELAFIEKIKADKRDRIGSWLASSPAIAGEVTIFKKGAKKLIEWSLRNGLKSTSEIIETRTWRGRRFDIKSGSKTYFLINNQNDLEIRDQRGLVATGERIEIDNNARRLAALSRLKSRLGATPEVVMHQTINRKKPVSASSPVSQIDGQDDALSLGEAPMPQLALQNASNSLIGTHLVKKRSIVAVKKRKERPPGRARVTTQDIFRAHFMR